MMLTTLSERLHGICCMTVVLLLRFQSHESLGPIDPRTLQKVVFINGDVSTGSANDLLMCDILGPNWKQLTAAEGEVLEEGCSPGFSHQTFGSLKDGAKLYDYWQTVIPLKFVTQ